MKARWTRWQATALLAVLPLGVAGPALAQDCLPLDMACVVDEVTEHAQGTVDDTVTTVTDTVGPVVDDTSDEVDRILGGGNEPPPPPDGGGGGDSGGGGDGGSGNGDGGAGPASGRSALPLGLRPAAITTGATITPSEQPVQLDNGTDLRDRFATTIAGAAKSLAVVAALLGIAVAFVLTQNRIDRSDPRLALAPVEADLVRFA
jgi:hypothetical protein